MFVCSFVIGHAIHQDRWLHAQDDQMYTLAIAVRYFDPSRYAAATEEFGKLVREHAESTWIVARYDARDRYKDNYAAFLRLIKLTFEGIPEWAPAYSAFPDRSALALSLSAGLTSISAMIVVLIALIMARNLRLTAAVAVLGVIVLYEGLIQLDLGDRLLPKRPGTAVDVFDVINRSVRVFIDTGESTFLFGAAPRCAFSLLLLAVFLFRWQGRSALGYWLFLPMSLLHQSQTGLFLAMVIALDVVLRPSELIKPRVILAIGGTLAIFLWRERLWMIIGPTGVVLAAAAITIVATTVFAIHQFYSGWYEWLILSTKRALSRLRALPLPTADAILLAIGWFAFLVLTAIGNYYAAPEQSTFFWNHIAGRVLGTVRTEIVVALVYTGLGALATNPMGRRLTIPGLAALTLLIMPPAYMAWPFATFPRVIERNAAAMAQFDGQTLQPGEKITGAHEALIYYRLAKGVATGTDQLRELR